MQSQFRFLVERQGVESAIIGFRKMAHWSLKAMHVRARLRHEFQLIQSSDELDRYFEKLSTEGPMARCVDDVARLLSTMSGWDDRAPLSLADTLPDPQAPDPIGCAHGKRVGWLGPIWPDLPLEPGILPLCEAALKTLEGLGCQVEPCTLDFPRERNWTAWLRLRQLLTGGKLAPLYADAHKRALLKPEAVWEIEQSHLLTAAQLYQASVSRTALYQAFRKLFERYD